MQGFPLFDIVLLAMIAGVILYRLYTVLGRKTGDEDRRPSNVLRLPEREKRAGAESPAEAGAVPAPEARRAAQGSERQSTPAAGSTAHDAQPPPEALTAIQLADRDFSPDEFAGGARQAYEMIVVAFAAGDRETLRELLADDVYLAFDAAIRAREAKQQTVDFAFKSLDEARIVEAELVGSKAEITVKFVSEIASYTRDAAGAIVEDEPGGARRVTDYWTFQRDLRDRDPNWLLVATAGEA